MVDPVSLQMVRDVVTIFGVIAGFSYYILTVRHQNHARKAQLLSSLSKDFSDFEMAKRAYIMWNWEWEDYDDFTTKYGSINPDAAAMCYTDWFWYNNLGMMLKNKLIDEDMIFDLYGTGIIMQWERWRGIIMEMRVRVQGSAYMESYEFLADRMKRVLQRRNITWELPRSIEQHFPDAKP